jgi:hypothetical protein
MTNSALHTALHQILDQEARKDAGFSASDITGYAPEHVRRAAQAMVAAGLLYRATVSPRRVRYFATAEMADQFKQRPTPTRPQQPVAGTRAKARWTADEPGIITAATRITKAPPLPNNVFRTNTYAQF